MYESGSGNLSSRRLNMDGDKRALFEVRISRTFRIGEKSCWDQMCNKREEKQELMVHKNRGTSQDSEPSLPFSTKVTFTLTAK